MFDMPSNQTNPNHTGGLPTKTDINKPCEDTGCCLEDLKDAMNSRDEWREKLKLLHAIRMWFEIYHWRVQENTANKQIIRL